MTEILAVVTFEVFLLNGSEWPDDAKRIWPPGIAVIGLSRSVGERMGIDETSRSA